MMLLLIIPLHPRNTTIHRVYHTQLPSLNLFSACCFNGWCVVHNRLPIIYLYRECFGYLVSIFAWFLSAPLFSPTFFSLYFYFSSLSILQLLTSFLCFILFAMVVCVCVCACIYTVVELPLLQDHPFSSLYVAVPSFLPDIVPIFYRCQSRALVSLKFTY
jgi:type IV secretory pathway VirB3-like protein